MSSLHHPIPSSISRYGGHTPLASVYGYVRIRQPASSAPLVDETHFSKNRLVFRPASDPQSDHAQRMSCDLSELLERTRPPDAELVDLIEKAFLEGQIDGLKADLAYSWLLAKNKDLCAVARI